MKKLEVTKKSRNTMKKFNEKNINIMFKNDREKKEITRDFKEITGEALQKLTDISSVDFSINNSNVNKICAELSLVSESFEDSLRKLTEFKSENLKKIEEDTNKCAAFISINNLEELLKESEKIQEEKSKKSKEFLDNFQRK